MKQIKLLLKKDMNNLQVSTKKEYQENGKSDNYFKLIEKYKELGQFKFMLNRYERKIRLNK